ETIKLTELALEGGTLAASTGARQIHFWDLNALGKRMAELDLPWELPVSGATLDQRSPLRVTVVERSIDSLQDEEEAIAALGSRELFRPTRAVAFRTRLGSYSDIDRALATPSFLVSEDARWSFFRGRAEPTEGLEWTEKEFSPEPAWEVGRTPISGWPAVRDVGAEGTRLPEQRLSYTTLYARAKFTVDDPSSIERLMLAIELEDGIVAYLNGEEVGRANAGKAGERLAATSVAPRRDRERSVEVFTIDPELLHSGENVLAVQVLSYGLDSFVHFLPV